MGDFDPFDIIIPAFLLILTLFGVGIMLHVMHTFVIWAGYRVIKSYAEKL